MKKILWLPSWYPNKNFPFNGDFIQRHARAVSFFQPVHVIFVVKDETNANNERVIVEHTTSGNISETIAYYKPRRTGIKQADRLISILKYIQVSKRLVKAFIKEEGIPSLVHVHVAVWAGITALWLKKKFKVPYLVTEHWTGYDKAAQDNLFKRDIFFRKSIKRVLQQATLILPVSDQLGKLIAGSFENINYQVIPNVVNTQYFNLSASRVPLFRFIHVSVMSYQKNCEGILYAFSKLLPFKQDIELLMVGPAPKELVVLSERLGLSGKVQWTGEIAYHEVAAMLQQSSCLVMFSRYENLPCVILEALCCGLPVIATHTGGIPEIINSQNGIMVSSGNGEELLAAMKEIIIKYAAYEKASISENAMTRFNYQAVGKIISGVYKTV